MLSNKYEIADRVRIPNICIDPDDIPYNYGIISDYEYRNSDGWFGWYYSIYDIELKRVCHFIREDSIELLKNVESV